MVGRIGVPSRSAGLVERLGGRVPGVTREAVHHDGPFRSVEIIAEISVGLYLPEIGQTVLEFPFGIAHLGPRVVVLGNSTEKDLPVDGAGASGDLASRNQHFRGLLRGFAGELPVMVADHDVDLGGVAELHLLGQLLKIRIVRSRFQQQDVLLRVFGKPCSDDGPGRTGAQDDIVVFHVPSSEN